MREKKCNFTVYSGLVRRRGKGGGGVFLSCMAIVV